MVITRFQALFVYKKHFYPDNYRLRFYDRRGLSESLEWAGFTPSHWSGIGRIWPFWESFFVVADKTDVPGPAPDRLLPRPSRNSSPPPAEISASPTPAEPSLEPLLIGEPAA